MDMLQFIKSRRSTRRFADRPVEEEKLNAVLDAACHAPSGGNNQSWHFLVIRDKVLLDELRDLTERAFAAMEYDETTYSSLVNSIRQSKKGGYVFHYDAPVLIVVANRKGYGNALVDSACALENMMLMANALDLGSCWINQLHWLDEDPTIRACLEAKGLGRDETICGALSLGYADTPDGLPNRTPLPRKEIKITML
ncbi:MAG: nitroreductase [Ruminococcaceae bacterium]|nr:nitroreductase [Oscillospiraceae bacterium]